MVLVCGCVYGEGGAVVNFVVVVPVLSVSKTHRAKHWRVNDGR